MLLLARARFHGCEQILLASHAQPRTFSQLKMALVHQLPHALPSLHTRQHCERGMHFLESSAFFIRRAVSALAGAALALAVGGGDTFASSGAAADVCSASSTVTDPNCLDKGIWPLTVCDA